jgi:hypothetical protein
MQCAHVDSGTNELFANSLSRSSESQLKSGLTQHDLQLHTSPTFKYFGAIIRRVLLRADSFSPQLLLARSIHLAPVPSTSFDSSTVTGAIRFFENP